MTTANVMSVQFEPVLGNKQANYKKAQDLIKKGIDKKPDLIVLSEFFTTGIDQSIFKNSAETESNSPTLDFFSKTAKHFSSYILCGSIIEFADNNYYNTSYLLDRNGGIAAKYRKIHLFDSFGGTENDVITPGENIVVVETDFAKIGLSICFDIKFPYHYLELIKHGAEIITVPAAWCVPSELKEKWTQDWLLTNKMRAIDNFSYIVSSNICGSINENIAGCGSSVIVSPNGDVLAQGKDNDSIISAQIDTHLVKTLRSQFNMKALVNF